MKRLRFWRALEIIMVAGIALVVTAKTIFAQQTTATEKTVCDLNLIYNLNKSTSLNFSVRDLFNETYEEYGGWSGPKRSLSFGVKRDFRW